MSLRTSARNRLIVLCLLVASCGTRDPLEEIRDLQAANRWGESAEQLAELVEERRSDPEVHYLYGLALQKAGRPSLAVWPLQRAMLDPEWHARAGVVLATVGFQTANFDEAVSTANTVLEEDPENAAALEIRLRARIHTRRDYAGALEDADRLLELSPESLPIETYRAVALLGLDRIDEAKESMERLADASADNALSGPFAPTLCGARAKFADESGDFEEAERRYRACLERFPVNGLVVKEAIEFFDTRGQRDEATEVLRQAHLTAPREREPRVQLAARLEALGDVAAAEALLREAIEDVDPQRAVVAHTDLAAFVVQHERYDEGVAEYERAIELAGAPSESLLFPYVDALILAGELERALEVADRIEAAPMRNILRGRAFLQEGRVREALDALSMGLASWPNQPAARYYAALAAERLGDLDRAVEEYRYAIRAGGAPEANLRLARLHYAMGNFEPALTALRQSAMGPAAALLEVEISAARSGDYPVLRGVLQREDQREASLAALARGWRRRLGPGGAAEVLLDPELHAVEGISGPALAELVDDLIETGRLKEAQGVVDGALVRHADSATVHALRGQLLEAQHAGTDEARRAYAKAFELDAELSRALEGLARQRQRAGDRAGALEHYERASAATAPYAPGTASLAAADLLLEDGRRQDAIAGLKEWLDRNPLDPQVALRLASLLSEEESERSEALRLAELATRLRAGPQAEVLAERLRKAG